MSNYDKLRGKRAHAVNATLYSASNPFVFPNGGFIVAVSAGTVNMEFEDGTTLLYSMGAKEVVNWVRVKKIIGGTAADCIAVHLAS